MSNDVHHIAILTSLEALFERATSENLWFVYPTPTGEENWYSPEYLREAQAQGQLVYSPEHWELRDPVGYLNQIITDVASRIDEYNALARQLGYHETLALESHSTHPADAH